MPLHVHFLPLLADAAPVAADPASAQSVGWILLSVAGLAAAANQILGLVRGFRSMQAPDPGSASADRVKALEDRVRSVELKMENHMGSINAKFDSISSTLTNLQSDWNYALGKIDGRNEMSGGQ